MTGLHRIDEIHHDHGDGEHDHHHGDGEHGHHHHGPQSQRQLLRSRRAFLGDMGKGTLAMAVFTPTVLAACSSDGAQPVATSADEAAESDTPVEAEADGQPSDLVWARSQLGFVSAYVLARGNSAAIVDTGIAGSATAIGETLGELGLNYSDVQHVLLTHHHGDHAGSIGEVLDMAVNATAYAGEADVASISADLTGLAGGEDIFGFEMLATPGHTAGHMAAIDHQAGLLIAGDAIFTEGPTAIEGPERFFADIAESRRSIAAMAALSFNTLLVGHGDPIEGGADFAVAALADSFG